MNNPVSYTLHPLPPPSRLSTIHLTSADGVEADTGARVTTQAMAAEVMKGTGIPERVMTPDGALFATVADVAKGGRL